MEFLFCDFASLHFLPCLSPWLFLLFSVWVWDCVELRRDKGCGCIIVWRVVWKKGKYFKPKKLEDYGCKPKWGKGGLLLSLFFFFFSGFSLSSSFDVEQTTNPTSNQEERRKRKVQEKKREGKQDLRTELFLDDREIEGGKRKKNENKKRNSFKLRINLLILINMDESVFCSRIRIWIVFYFVVQNFLVSKKRKRKEREKREKRERERESWKSFLSFVWCEDFVFFLLVDSCCWVCVLCFVFCVFVFCVFVLCFVSGSDRSSTFSFSFLLPSSPTLFHFLLFLISFSHISSLSLKLNFHFFFRQGLRSSQKKLNLENWLEKVLLGKCTKENVEGKKWLWKCLKIWIWVKMKRLVFERKLRLWVRFVCFFLFVFFCLFVFFVCFFFCLFFFVCFCFWCGCVFFVCVWTLLIFLSHLFFFSPSFFFNKQLVHPNLVLFLGACTSGDEYRIVTDLMPKVFFFLFFFSFFSFFSFFLLMVFVLGFGNSLFKRKGERIFSLRSY